jgi:outer membrane protein insertion porin family
MARHHIGNRSLLQRAWRCCALALLAALVGVNALVERAAAQGGMGGGFPSVPPSMFGKKEPEREASGPSLSATDEPVAEIRVVGNSTIPTTQILNQLQTRVGRPFDPALVQRDVRKLVSRGWFVDVQPTYEQGATGRVVILKVVERPVIRFVEYLGNEKIRDKKLAKETELKVGGPVDPYAVEEARRKLLDLYRRSGFNQAQVTVLKGKENTDNGVVFVIHEGLQQKVWDVDFVGNEFVRDGRLKTQIESKPPLMLIFKGYVDEEQIDADVQKLTAYYRAFGFFQAKVGRQFEFDEKNKWLTLRFVIHEGPRYQVEKISFIGNKIFASDSLAMGIKLPGGEPFEQAKMNGDVEWLKELYGSQGYVFADIRAEPIFSEEPGKLDVMYHIEEGKRWRVGNIRVHITGDNPHTKIQTALNRLSIRSGEIVDIRELRASERRLQASGLFMADPARGVMPKITYQIPELRDTEVAEGQGGPGFRGQSPDQVGPPSRGGLLPSSAARLAAPTAGPPLLPPPGSMPPGSNPPAPAQTYLVTPPPGFAPADDQIDVDLYLETSPTAIRHEVRRPPFGDASTATSAATVPPSGTRSIYERQTFKPYHYAESSQPAQPNPYQKLTIRTQSPYQMPTTGSYGGQAVGATGPEAAPIGASPYAVHQAVVADPQRPSPTAGSPVLLAQVPSSGPPFAPPTLPQYGTPPPQYPPQYGPPQIMPPPQQYAAPQPGYSPAPAPGPPIQYGPAPVLAPDPNITPVTPLPTNPQLSPYQPLDPFTPMFVDPAVDLDVVLSEAQTGRLMLGVAVNSDAGLVGQILLDEQNFDWTRFPTSWDDFASGRAWRGDGQRFRIEAAPGTEVQRYLVSFTEPYLWDTPVSLGLSGSFFDRRYIDWDEQRLGGRVSLGYQWTENDLSAAFSYRGENVNIRDISTPIPELTEVFGDNILHGFKVTVANDTRDSAFLATQGHYLELSFEQVVGSFTYPRAIIDARQYFLLQERPDHSGRHVLTLSARLGITGDDTPIYENFFAGGYSTLRGFDFRGASPVRLPERVQVGGEFMWVNTVEYLFPLTADDMIHGVAFVDFGTVEENVEINDFRVAPGFGLRVTVPAMGPAPIALDFAFPIASAEFDDEQVFSFNIGLQR